MNKEINDVKFDWVDNEIFKFLCFDIPNVYHYQGESKEGINIIKNINNVITLYNNFKILPSEFLKKLKVIFSNIPIDSYRKYFYIKNFEYYENIVKKQTRYIINGVGGIGKSRFIYELEEKLTYYNINHFVMYGKHSEGFDEELFNQIVNDSRNQRFVLVIDAVNEIENFNCYYDFIENNINNEYLSIILTYRDDTFDPSKLLDLNFSTDVFKGVEYTSAISEIVSKEHDKGKVITDFINMANIFNTNNALHLKIICDYYKNSKREKNKLNSVTTITFFLEQYYKNSFKSLSKNLWNFSKKISKKMYELKVNKIYYSDLVELEKDEEELKKYIDILKQNGFIYSYKDKKGRVSYYYGIQILHEFLIVRNFLSDINKEDEVGLIIKKTNELSHAFPYSHKYIPLILFDIIEDIDKVIAIIEGAEYIDLDEYFLSNLFSYPKQYIDVFQKKIKIETLRALHLFGGKKNLAFNCFNYINNIYFEDEKKLMNDIIQIDNDDYILDQTFLKLKSMLYRVVNAQIDKEDKDEFFSNAIWLLVSQNNNIQILSMKLIMYIIESDSCYLNDIIEIYNKISNVFLKNNIICLLTHLSRGNNIITNFLTGIFEDYNYTNSKNLTRINNYLYNDDSCLVECPRVNKYLIVNNGEIDEKFKRIYFLLNIYYKDEFIIRDGYGEDFTSYKNFIDSDRYIISTLNKLINKKYSKIINEASMGSSVIDWNEKKDYSKNYKKLDVNKIIKIIFEEFDKICKGYDLLFEDNFRYESNKSLLYKTMKLAEENAFGSIMCNYYTDELIDYKCDDMKIGFQIYNPIEYEPDRMNLYADISIFNETANNLDNKVMKILYQNDTVKDKKWADDLNCSISMINRIIQPIKYDKDTWIPISMYLDNNSNDKMYKWRETYSIYCSYNTNHTINDDSNDRYLTIEHQNYNNCIKDYSDNLKNSDLSLNVKPLMESNNFLKFYNLLLPPASIIKFLNLTYSVKKCSWVRGQDEVIIFNGTSTNMFEKGVRNSFYINEKYYKELSDNGIIKLFGYTEKLFENSGYSDKSAIHYEIKDYKIIKQFYNYKNNKNIEESNDNTTTVIDYKSYLAKFNIIDDIE